MSAVGRTFTKLRNQVMALTDACAALESSKAPASLADTVDLQRQAVEGLAAAVATLETAFEGVASSSAGSAVRSVVSAELTIAGQGWKAIPGLVCHVTLDEPGNVGARFQLNCAGSGQTRSFAVIVDGLLPTGGSRPTASAHMDWPADVNQLSTISAEAFFDLSVGAHVLQVYTYCDNDAPFYVNRSVADGVPSDRLYTSHLEVSGPCASPQVIPALNQDVACFTYSSGSQTFHHVPEFLHVERLDVGRYKVTNLLPGQSYLQSPPRFVALGNECNDGALCTVVVWTPSLTPDSFEVWFMYNGSRYDGNYGGTAPNDFISFLLFPRSAVLA